MSILDELTIVNPEVNAPKSAQYSEIQELIAVWETYAKQQECKIE
jgi:hypothetical protein